MNLLRKNLAGLVFLLLCLIPAQAYQRHSIFLGGGVGMDYQEMVKPSGYSFAWNIYGGYAYKPLRQITVMSYLESLMSIKPYELSTRVGLQLSINADAAFEVLNLGQRTRVGPYIGIGLGYLSFTPTIEDRANNIQVLFLTNLGFQMIVDETNLIRLGVKLPFSFMQKEISGVSVTLSYAYQF